jgi:DNA-binding NarL/FixJ family response regulator
MHPDVAVLDIQMPRVSGIEAARWIRANCSDVGVLILTAYDDDPYVMAVLQAGANGYVLKTASPGELIQAVRDVHEGKSALDASIAKKLMAHFLPGQRTMAVEALTEREMEVLALAAKGYTNKAIGVQRGFVDAAPAETAVAAAEEAAPRSEPGRGSRVIIRVPLHAIAE